MCYHYCPSKVCCVSAMFYKTTLIMWIFVIFKRANIERNMCVWYVCLLYVGSKLLWVGLYVSTQLVLRSPLAGTMYRQTLSSDGGGLLQTFYSQNFRFNSIHEFKFTETLSKSDCMQYEVWKMFSESDCLRFKILTSELKSC